MRILEFPTWLLVPNAEEWQIDYRTKSGGMTLNGREQISGSPTFRWKAKLNFEFNDDLRIRTWKAIIAKAQGRLAAIQTRPLDIVDPKKYISSNAQILYQNASGGFVPHSNGVGFAAANPTISVGVYPKNTNSITLNLSVYNNALQVANFFGIDGKMYIVTSIYYVGSVATMEFEPPLQSATTASSKFTLKPTVHMRLNDDASGSHSIMLGKSMTASLDLVEVLDLP